MLKRVAYLFLFTWLIIASAGNFGGNIFGIDASGSHRLNTTAYTGPLLTTDDASFYEDSPVSSDNKTRNTRCRMRFLMARAVEFGTIVPYYQLVPGYVSVHVKQLFSKHIVRRASLPAYYGFLFRLSPF